MDALALKIDETESCYKFKSEPLRASDLNRTVFYTKPPTTDSDNVQSLSRKLTGDQEGSEISEKNPSIVKTKINDLLIENYKLKKPIEAILKFYPEEVLAVIPELEIFGEGNSEIGAINDLKLELLDLFDDLKDVPEEQLGKFPNSWKKIITSLIKENENKTV